MDYQTADQAGQGYSMQPVVVQVCTGLALLLALSISADLSASALGLMMAADGSTPGGISLAIVQVKFQPHADLRQPKAALPPALRPLVVAINPLFTANDPALDALGAARLKRWFQITLEPGVDVADFIARLRQANTIAVAERAPLPLPPGVR